MSTKIPVKKTSETVWRYYEAETREVFGISPRETIEEVSVEGERIIVNTREEKKVR